MKQTEQTLLEQMRITEFDIECRKALLSITPQDLEAIAGFRDTIEQHIDHIVSDFYKIQTNIPEIGLLIGDADTLSRLKVAQRRYILDLFGGNYDMEYVNNRLRIGLVHKRIGVEPKLYLSAIHVLREQMLKTLADNTDPAVFARGLAALDKVLLFDITLVFETYIRSLVSEIESAKKKSEEYAANLEMLINERNHQLRTDPLTGTLNRRFLADTLSRTLRMAQRRAEPVTLVFIDVNKFKEMNDTHGHPYGDEVLRVLGEILLNCMRGEDHCFRYGGDEFCIILSNCTEHDARHITCKRVYQELGERLGHVSLSVGVAQTGPDRYEEPEAFLKLADSRMYQEKAALRQTA